MNPTQPQTPTRPCIDPTRSKGTPRRHKSPNQNQNPGIRRPGMTIEELRKKLLKLSFTPEEWQVHIQRVKRGYDSIFLAGTGYGKSLVLLGGFLSFFFFFRWSATRSLRSRGQEFSATIATSPLNTFVYCVSLLWTIRNTLDLFYSYSRAYINIFANLRHVEGTSSYE